MQPTSTQKRAAAWIGIALVAALGPVITPFAVASVLAYALTPLVDRLFNAVLIPVALFYLLMDWDRFVAFAHEADQVLGQYLRGQLLVMLIMAVFYSTGLALFGLDLALPASAVLLVAMRRVRVGYLGSKLYRS